MAGSTIDLTALVDPARYRAGPPHDTWTEMRREAPVLWCEIDGCKPFWALTRHADIRFVSTHPELFSSAGRIVLAPASDAQSQSLGQSFGRSVVTTDPPEHREYRALAAPFFRPSVLKGLEARIREITRTQLDVFAAKGANHDVDFVTDLASWHPLKMICEILGLTEEHEPIVLRISNELFGSTDPEFARDQASLMVEMYGFLGKVVAEKRAHPGDDLSSVLASALLNGEPLSDADLMLYLVVLITAGHETTRNSLAGGMLAFLENPDQLDLLRSDLGLAESAANEIVRWTSPIMQFMRTAVVDTEVRGQPIKAGETLALYYPSGNRDEEVFGDPFSFRVDRDPNPHLGWGVGEHYCLGAALARMEIRVLLEELVPRLDHAELAGVPHWTEAIFASGVKHLPLRWTISPSP